eukprot:COSAG04_NODE_2842_length_3494_cov_36.862739_4_plen_497_part_01
MMSSEMYEAKRGRKDVKLQVSQMGVSVFDKKGQKKDTTYLYQNLVSWGEEDGAVVLATNDESAEFKTEHAEEIVQEMTTQAQALAQAMRAQKKAEKEESPAPDEQPDDGEESSEPEDESMLSGEEDDEEEEDAESIVGSKYEAIAKGAIRAGFELDSDKLGALKVGNVIEALEARKNDDGIMRVRFAQGWTSLTARSGTVLLEKTADDATVTSIVLKESEATKDAKAAEAEAFLAAQQAAQQLDKTYEIKQKRNKVSVQLSPMALVVTQGKKPPTSYLYQTLTSWATTDKGFEVTPSSGESIEFTCTEDEAEEICGGMTEKAKGLAKAARAQKKAEKVAAEESASAAAEADDDAEADGAGVGSAGSEDSEPEDDSMLSDKEEEPEPEESPAPSVEPEPEEEEDSEPEDESMADEAGEEGGEEEEDAESIVGSKYEAIAKGAIRAGFELDSDKLSALKVGNVIEVLEARKNDDGIMRVRFAQGWTSLTARSGTVLLEK